MRAHCKNDFFLSANLAGIYAGQVFPMPDNWAMNVRHTCRTFFIYDGHVHAEMSGTHTGVSSTTRYICWTRAGLFFKKNTTYQNRMDTGEHSEHKALYLS